MNDELIQINADQYKVSKAIKRKIDKLTFTNILSKQRTQLWVAYAFQLG